MTLEDTIHTVIESLRENGATQELIDKTVKDLRKTAEQEKALRKSANGKKAKHQFVVLKLRSVNTPANGDHLGWVLQLEEAASPAVAYSRVVAAANAFNESRKGRRIPVKTVGECLENVPAKWFKTSNPNEVTRVKTRVPVALLTIPANELPK